MENQSEKLEMKNLLEKVSQVKVSPDFTLNVMESIEAFEHKKARVPKYFKISFALMILSIIVSFYVLSYFSTISCQLIKTHCHIFQYMFAGILASLILIQLNFLIVRFSQYKHALVF